MSTEKEITKRLVNGHVYLLPCPRCDAGAGERCWVLGAERNVVRRGNPHSERARAASAPRKQTKICDGLNGSCFERVEFDGDDLCPWCTEKAKEL